MSFRDEAYEKLDYLSQLTEVVTGPQNEILAQIPDSIIISSTLIRDNARREWGALIAMNLCVRDVIRPYLAQDQLEYVDAIVDGFEFEVSPDFEMDLSTRKITGSITLKKVNHQIDEKEMLAHALEQASAFIKHFEWPTKRTKEKVHTLLNFLETGTGDAWLKEVVATGKRPGYYAQKILIKTMSSLITENKWRIRDVKMIANIGRWIQDYMTERNEFGLVNLMKLKMMIEKDLPIYSMTEVKGVSSVIAA